jgi:hypothetical protein
MLRRRKSKRKPRHPFALLASANALEKSNGESLFTNELRREYDSRRIRLDTFERWIRFTSSESYGDVKGVRLCYVCELVWMLKNVTR